MSGDRKFPLEEPSADLREAAAALRQTFVAIVQAGFTEAQALMVVAEIIKAKIK